MFGFCSFIGWCEEKIKEKHARTIKDMMPPLCCGEPMMTVPVDLVFDLYNKSKSWALYSCKECGKEVPIK